jgi:hypothetical protein
VQATDDDASATCLLTTAATKSKRHGSSLVNVPLFGFAWSPATDFEAIGDRTYASEHSSRCSNDL